MQINTEKNKEDFIQILKSTNRERIDDLIAYLEKTDFFTAPASSKFHLNVKGGLVQHSLNVYKVLQKLNGEFGKIPEQSTKIIALLHDICKINHYKPNILKSGQVSTAIPYQVEELVPLGHGEKSVIILDQFITLTDQEKVCIRWHMAHYDRSFSQNESKIKETFPEAYYVYFADHLATLFLDDVENDQI